MLTVFINGMQEAQFNCGESSPGGTFSLPAQTFPVPATLSSYLVQLYIVATWSPTAMAPYSTVSVNVPPDSSIDILTQGGVPGTPAPPTLVLTLIGILFLSLIAFGIGAGNRRADFRQAIPDTRHSICPELLQHLSRLDMNS